MQCSRYQAGSVLPGRRLRGWVDGSARAFYGCLAIERAGASRNIETSASLVLHSIGERPMDWNRVEGNWKEMKGKVKEQWGKLTDDDLDVIAGKQDQLEGRLQQRYGYAKDQAKKEIDDWYSRQRWS